MARRKVREQKSKVYGTKQVLTQLNRAAHQEEHQNATHGSPGGTTTTSILKWQGSAT
jgi:UDP-N-acetylmuramate-alanine ligase